jgi:hypothetical protein
MALAPPQGNFTIPTTAYPKSSAESTSTSGFDWGSAAGGTLQGLLGKIGNFNIPTTAVPTSTSSSTGGSTSTGVNQATSAQQSAGQQQATSAQQSLGQQQATSAQQSLGQQQATSQQQAQSLQNSAGQSGIDWSNPLTAAILPSLISSGQGLQGVANNVGQTVQDQYSNMMNQAMGPQAFQGTLNELASRNMLNSSVAGNAMAQTAVPIAQAIGNQGFQSALAGQQAQMQVPTTLSQLAQLGQQSTQQSTGTSQSTGGSQSTGNQSSTGSSQSTGSQSSTGSSQSTGSQQSTGSSQSTGSQQSQSTQASESLNTNPLAAYQAMAQFYPSILQALGGVGSTSEATQTSSSTNELSPYELMAQMVIANQMA